MNAQDRVPPRDLAFFASLYALQGVVVAYFFNYNQIYMQSLGIARDQAAGVQSLALVPFILKFLCGPFSDRVNLLGLGHRRPYILLGVVVQSLGLLGLSWIDPVRSLAGFGMVACLAVAGMALYDTCCDGMVLDLTPPHDRGRVQGTLVASRFVSAMAFSYGFGVWLEGTGGGPERFQRVIWVCAGLGLLPLLQGVAASEPSRGGGVAAYGGWSALRVMVLPRSLILLAFGALYSMVGYGVEINLSPYYQKLRFTEADVGTFASLRYLGRALGAVLMGWSIVRLGRRRTLVAGIVALALATAYQAVLSSWMSAAAGGLAFGLVNGWDDALFFVLAMEASDARMAAFTYALFMAVTNVSVVGGWLFARTASVMGDQDAPVFLLAALTSLGTLPLIPGLCRPATRRETRHADA